MAVAVPPSDLEKLLKRLESLLPHSFKVYGELRSFLEGKWPGLTFIVDEWPEFKAIVTKPDPAKVKTPYVAKVCSIFATDSKAFENLLQQPDAVNWSGRVSFSAIEESLWTALQEVAKVKGGNLKMLGEGPNFVYLATEETLKYQSTPEGLTLSPMSVEQVDFVLQRWKHSQCGARSFISALLENFPSLALRDAEGATLGYIMSYHHSAIGFLHVEPEHRGKGLGKLLLSRMAREHLEKGNRALSMIEHDNVISQKLHESMGFSRIENLNIRWFSHSPSGCCGATGSLCCV